MDKIEQYKEIIKTELKNWEGYHNSDMPNIEYQLIIDQNQEQFILLSVGWHNESYIHNWLFHLQLKDGQVWIHEDMTDAGIAKLLQEKGVPKSDIVLGFVDPLLRENIKLEEIKH